jgi:hypothetical protein
MIRSNAIEVHDDLAAWWRDGGMACCDGLADGPENSGLAVIIIFKAAS